MRHPLMSFLCCAAALALGVCQAQAPMASPPAPSPDASAPVDLSGYPLSTAALPPFPYLKLPASAQASPKAPQFDQTGVIVGARLHLVEGRFQRFDIPHTGRGRNRQTALQEYGKAVEALGGVKVNKITPDNEAFRSANGGDFISINKMLRTDLRHSYDAYLIRTAAGRAWIVLMVSDAASRIVAIEETNVPSSVRFIKRQP